MWLYPVSVDKNVYGCILPKLCLTPEIKSKYFRIGECVGIGQITVDHDQMPHYVTSGLDLHCLPMTLFEFPGKNGFT